MSDLLGVDVEELVHTLKQRRARLPFEIGAFIALELSESLLQGPAAPATTDVRITEEGEVVVSLSPNSASSADAARSVVGVLGHLLVAAGQGVPPVLVRLVEEGPESGQWDLSRLRDELEASLVPLNRAAARRVLARLIRETRREPGENTGAKGAEPAGEQDLDADLDALLDDPGPPTASGPAGPAAALAPAAEPSPGFDEDATTAERELPEHRGASPAQELPADEAPPAPLPRDRRDDALRQATPPTAGAGADVASANLPREEPPVGPFAGTPESIRPGPSVDEIERGEQTRGTRGWVWLLLFALLIGGLVAGVALFRPDAIERMLGEGEARRAAADAQRRREREKERQTMLAEHRRGFGDLSVRAEPERAQILLFVERGPALAEGLPVGVAHEFVAIADGKRPTRAVVPKDAKWQSGKEGPRYELAMQAGDESMAFEELLLGESKLPRDVGRPSGKRGTVRIVTNPPGAKVYVLVGFAPQARVRDLPTDEAHELLVARDGYRPKRVVVGPSDWQTTGDAPAAEVEVVLEERPAE